MWFTFGEILSNIVKTMKTGKNASFRNVVERHRSVTLFSFLDVQIAWLQTVGRDGTAQNYQRARNSFSLYRCGRDIPLRSVTSELICDYESWLKRRSVTRNTVSFYMRICARYITRRSREDLYLRPPRSSMCIQVSRRPGNGRSMKGPWCGYSNSISQAAHRSVLHVIFSCSVFIVGEWPLSIWPICVNPMSTAAY